MTAGSVLEVPVDSSFEAFVESHFSLKAKEFFGALDSDLLDGIDVMAAVVPPRVGIAFRVLIGEGAALRLEDLLADEVFARDKLQVVVFPFRLGEDRVIDVGVCSFEVIHGYALLI